MIKKLLITICLFVSSHAVDNLTAQKQNALYVQNLIEIEENIAKNFEKYILTEFKIPALSDLIDDDYLGSNFSTSNIMGSTIAFEDTKNLKIKYAVTKDAYREKANSSSSENYIVQLYNRDLYRSLTSVYYDSSTISNSYVQIILQSDEAKTIFDLLKSGLSIEKECTSTSVSTYCNNANNSKTFRWYNESSKWIEYDKAKFNKGDISTSMTVTELQSETKISDLAVGSYIFISSERYVKLVDDVSSGTAVIQILKVD
jgi:hypothetical protein